MTPNRKETLMSESTNVTVVVPESTEVPQKTPFYRNPRIVKPVAITAAAVGATLLAVRAFSKKDSDEDSAETDTIDIVIED
jgi:negative regulator of sigma E activity